MLTFVMSFLIFIMSFIFDANLLKTFNSSYASVDLNVSIYLTIVSGYLVNTSGRASLDSYFLVCVVGGSVGQWPKDSVRHKSTILNQRQLRSLSQSQTKRKEIR